jgi:hypothetical protein
VRAFVIALVVASTGLALASWLASATHIRAPDGVAPVPVWSAATADPAVWRCTVRVVGHMVESDPACRVFVISVAGRPVAAVSIRSTEPGRGA